ncbi:amino acid adenylation domain-containing protein [Dictyobacter arantiisoli]|uniref:Carrier domain-containing protein n=1 Tax=Dictyobacter arantiisoli TaxID=2014874 RepID=A0A5A5TA39_9CHLR|nr:non-ribosomal peptide synthetase [Dictyobacter arantiisoli]GCF08361.1 hypothetical protein KDI_19250 [Dictyobacter arantiisoli]
MPETLIESFRLSPQQRHLCALLRPEESFPYRTHISARLQGPLDLSRLSGALRQLVERYEILRTNFPRQAGFALPAQVIAQDTPLLLEIYDCSAIPAHEQEEMREKLQEAFKKRPFDLTAGPAWRVMLIRYSPERHWLWWDMATLNADVQSCHALLQELSQLYSGQDTQSEEEEEEEPLQYADLSEWLYDILQSGEGTQGNTYWRAAERVPGITTSLPYEHVSDPFAPFAPQTLTLELPSEMLARLQALSSQLNVAEHCLLLAGWGALLSRLTGQTSLLIGTRYNGREYTEIAKAVGLFARSLPLSYQFSEGAGYSEIARQIEETIRQGEEWQDCFSWQIVEASGEREPFCPLGFIYETLPAPWQAGEIAWLVEEQEMYEDRFKVCLSCRRGSESLLVSLHYDPHAFSQQDMQRLLEQWQTVCEQILANPDELLSTLHLLTAHEKHILVSEWNATQDNDLTEQGIHQLFEAQVRRTPDAPALRYGEHLLSYEQLEQQANQLAHLLLAKGLQPGGYVTLCLPRDHRAIISLLAVLKAGGTYIPLEMDMPTARLQVLLQQYTPALTISSQELLKHLPTLTTPVLLIDMLTQQLAEQPTTAPEIETVPDGLAYVITTSGSTGVPKGVMVRQHSVSNYTQALCKLLTVQPGWHFATVTSLAADLGNTSIFCGLASGGCVHVLPYELVTDASALSDYTRNYPLDVLKIVPSHLQILLSTGTTGLLPAKRLVLGGEVLPWSLVQQIQHQQPDCQIFNHYGPTEATVGSLVYPLGPTQQGPHSVPIGRPIANVQVYVLDEQLQLTPIGVAGELYIGGAGIARGYLANPAITAEQFVPDPFSSIAGVRLYRTGDRARYRSDGTLEFLGRRDAQIKIRGYRVELGEIENQLRRHPDVREAVVQLWEEEGKEGKLVGYIVPWQQPGPRQEQLKQALLEQLPQYMVPGQIMCLEQLPLTTNGKVDRRHLPAPQAREQEESRHQQQVHTPIEEVMLGVWQEILNLKSIDKNDNFFQIGGHSLLGTRATSRLQEIFGIAVPIVWLFEDPTVVQLARRIEEALRRQHTQIISPIEASSRPEYLPLSFAQQRLWFLNQLEPDSTAYHIPQATRVRGLLNRIALEQALLGVIQRHENLRTTFPMREEQPIQQISPKPLTRMPVVDLSKLGQQEGEDEARRLAQQEAQQPFDLVNGPLLRCWLLQLESQEDTVLLLTMHHIISDGWSMSILVRELTSLYTAFPHMETASLPALPIQYADYALWQRSSLQGEVLERQLDYWKTQLSGLATQNLPTDHPRQVVQGFQSKWQRVQLPPELTQQLQALSQREGATLFMTLLASFQVLLARYSGQYDIAVGTPIANRTREELAGLIGFFINTLVLRADLSDNPSFVDLLAQVRATALGAYTHQDTPFEQVVEALQPQRDRSRPPLFQAVFVLQNTPDADVSAELSSLQMQGFDVEQNISQSELRMVVTKNEQGLNADLEYSTALFDSATIKRWLCHWRRLLDEIVADPRQRVLTLPMLIETEKQQIVEEWNASQLAMPEHPSLHQLFEAQVIHEPDAVALVFGENQLTYAALEQRANQLAHYLRAQGIGPDMLVGLYTGRSQEMIIGLLGILKAGAAYVPLDPAYPADRLKFILEDTQVSLVLTCEPLLAQLPAEHVSTLCLDTDWRTIARQTGEKPLGVTDPQHLAYVIYTSGSTGKPKGVLIQHRSICNTIITSIQACEIGRREHIAQCASLSFDVSILEIFLALLSGSRLCLVTSETVASGVDLASLLRYQAITVMIVTPSHLEILPATDFPALQTLLIGGETCSDQTMARWAAGRRFFTVYGPTEAAIQATTQQRTGPYLQGPLIGRPLANVQVYLLDIYQQPVPIGVPGELCIGGEGLARGYLHQPTLTAERFVPDPFGQRPGQRLYRTGDQARYRANGTIEFLGRQDTQVKLRGYRIELGEIEAVLNQHPQVFQNVVVVKGEEATEKQLVAYVVMDKGAGSTLNTAELRGYLKEHLPEYMIPAYFILLDALPLTPNGKVDQRALPSDRERLHSDDAYTAPRNPIEEALLTIWSDLLDLDQIDISDNFFELGGHSLLATQVIARLRSMLDVELPLQAFFEFPTVAGLAAQLQQVQVLPAPPIVPISREQLLPLSFAQQRLWFLDQLEPGNTAYTIPITVEFEGQLNLKAFKTALTQLIERHEGLRTTFQEREGQPYQVIALPENADITFIDLRTLAPERREEVARELCAQEARLPFDLSRGPLLRCYLWHLSEQKHWLRLNMHHIVSDGWSMGILVREFASLYQAASFGESASLSPLPIQYADYAHWQRTWLQGEVLKEQIRYWTNQLNQAHALQLPTDYPRPRTLSYQGAQHEIQLGAELTLALQQLGQQEGATLFMTLLTAFQALLYRLSGNEDIVVGTDSANRSHLETERLIGFFVNLLALRAHVNGKLPFHDLLQQVHETVLNAYMHQELPFEMIIEHLHIPREGNRTPLVNVLFVMQNIPLTSAELPGLAIHPIDNDTASVKFDLALFVTEEPSGLSCSVNYSPELFKDVTIKRMMSHYKTLLHDIVAHPESPIDHLEIYTEEEGQQRTIQKGKSLKRQLSKLKEFKKDLIDLSAEE